MMYQMLGHAQHPKQSDLDPVLAWARLSLALPRIPQLRKLQIELDHTEEPTWSIVNERAVLSDLAVMEPHPILEIIVTLPNLHPKWSSPERHFTEDSSHGTLLVKRAHRLRHFAMEAGNGTFEVAYKPDFPLTSEIANVEELGNIPMEALEDWERGIWEQGRHPHEEFGDGVGLVIPSGLWRWMQRSTILS
jgi:hypothetical protein